MMMMIRSGPLALLSLALIATSATADIYITEIANKGTTDGTCNGNDWIELYNDGLEAVNLSDGYLLHDDKGYDNEDAFEFPAGTPELEAGQYRVLCTKMKMEPTTDEGDDTISASLVGDPLSPQFGIGGDDTIALMRKKAIDETTSSATDVSVFRQGDFTTWEVLARVGALPNTDDRVDVTYALNLETGLFNYTSVPTPNAANIFVRLLTGPELLDRHRAKLKAQDAQGRQFFGVDERGYELSDAEKMDTLLEVHVTMNTEDYAFVEANKTFEMYRPFQSLKVVTADGQEITSLASPGRIRPKGQSTLFMATCMGAETIPWQLDMDTTNRSQTLFGMERMYLRHHMADYSYMRDYAYNRMLARFGLPHTRARKVHFYINGELKGLYTLLEATNQEYVFARNFPNYNPASFALFKIKSFTQNCGSYTDEALAAAAPLVESSVLPPYSFQRGGHREPVEELGIMEYKQCIKNFREQVYDVDFVNVVVAYLRYDRDCADMMMSEGLIDRDLGSSDWDKAMKWFIGDNIQGSHKCNVGCENRQLLAQEVDMENVLKSFAFYAVSLITDSPLVNGNNFYLAQAGDEANGGPGGWKIVPYDFNAAAVVFCHDQLCNGRMVHWNIARPTCTSLEQNYFVGPILTNATLHARYLQYVDEFLTTIYANQTFIQELTDHAHEMDAAVRSDFWALFGVFYDKELSPEEANWEEEGARFPLLPTMKARAEDVRAQLDAIEAGTFPRGPHVGINGDNDPWEPCADWRLEEANTTLCGEEGCDYFGCHMEDWTVPSYCNEEDGKCYHGNADRQCDGVYDQYQYDGMENMEDGRPTFCLFSKGVSVKAAECPAVGAVKATIAETTSSATAGSFFLHFALVAFAVTWFVR